MQWVMDVCRWTRAGGATRSNLHDLCCSKNALVVERTFGLLIGSRRLVRDARVIAGTLKDVYLPSYDSYYGKATGIKFDLSIFKTSS